MPAEVAVVSGVSSITSKEEVIVYLAQYFPNKIFQIRTIGKLKFQH